MKVLITSLFLFSIPIFLFAQTESSANQKTHNLSIRQANAPIKVDGILEENAWQQADIATDFWQNKPQDGIRASSKTEMRVTYDENFLYVGGICYDSTNHVITTLKRDIGYWKGDGVGIILDPLNEASSGFLFGTNPYGVQNEALLGGGSGSRFLNTNWDNRWFVETKRYDDRWTVEMAIPFKTLRYEEGKTIWGINFMRNDVKNNKLNSWAPIPLQFWMIDLGYTGRLEWDKAPKKTKGNIAIIPYVNAATSKNFQANETADNSFNTGVDAKIALSSSLNLDLTVNPDFSQVEVDQQVTNLTRFSIFLPERRTFFLENSDIFTQVGFPSIQPFFSRRVGLDQFGRTVPILYGARLTGNVTNTTRIGIMNVQTKATDLQLSQNYLATTFSQRVFKRSRMQGLFTNRQAFQDGDAHATDYGRNLSLKFNYLNESGSFEFWSGYHKSFKNGISGDDFFTENGVGYAGKKLSILIDHIYLGNNYYADMGFLNRVENFDASTNSIVRLGYHWFLMPITLRFIPENSKRLNQHSLKIFSQVFLDPDGKFVENSNSLSYIFSYKNSSLLSFNITNNETDLRFPFSFTGGQPLPIGRYKYNQFSANYDSDVRKDFQYGLSLNKGGFYNGDITSGTLTLLFRRPPWGNFGATIEYNDLSFPDEFGERTLWSFSPRIEISFNRNLFWTTFMQYTKQINNFNINSRFQWRFAPMSDVFLVYTDNYAIENFGKKNRAIVLKVNYWLAL